MFWAGRSWELAAVIAHTPFLRSQGNLDISLCANYTAQRLVFYQVIELDFQ